MKVCFVGLGSIGKRHLKNLYLVCKRRGVFLEVHALRNNKNILDDDIDKIVNKQFYNKNEMDSHYDMIFLTNPTNLHYKSLLELRDYSKAFFIEKPVFENVYEDLRELNLHADGKYYVACPLRHTNVIKYLNDFTKENDIYSARVISSSYLPNWRPGIDYRTIYSSYKEQGGGVCIDLIHEWDYISYLFGFPEKSKFFSDKVSHLEITSEDLAIYIAKYKDKLVELHLDYFGRVPRRSIELFTKDATIMVDILNSKISFSDEREDIKFIEDSNDKYIKEIEYFLDLCQGKEENINDIVNAIKVLKIAQTENI
ncbi:dehydrogenase [Clostridium sp. CTA-7]